MKVTRTPEDLNAGNKYPLHYDAGHGWLQVPRSDLVALNILDKITSYSYQKGSDVFLEEHADLSTFCRAYEERFGVNMRDIRLSNEIYDGDDSPIRHYASYKWS